MSTKMFQALKTTKMYWALMSLRISVYPNLNPPHGYLIMDWLLQFVAWYPIKSSAPIFVKTVSTLRDTLL